MLTTLNPSYSFPAQWPFSGLHVPGLLEVNVCPDGNVRMLVLNAKWHTEGCTWDNCPLTSPQCSLIYESCGSRCGLPDYICIRPGSSAQCPLQEVTQNKILCKWYGVACFVFPSPITFSVGRYTLLCLFHLLTTPFDTCILSFVDFCCISSHSQIRETAWVEGWLSSFLLLQLGNILHFRSN